MRFTAVVAYLCLGLTPAALAAAGVIADRGDAQDVIAKPDDDLSIPGESPLKLCPGEHGDDLITIDKVDLLPNPPQAGKELVIKASGTVKKTIKKGSYVILTVKYGLIKLLTTKADLCEQVGNVDLECPIKEGKMEITKNVDLPAEIPPGSYTVFADVFTEEDDKITCLTATVSFSRGGGGFFNLEL